MTRQRLILIVAAALYLAWLSWLALTVSEKGTVQIVSRAQLAAATHWVVAEVSVGPDGVPNGTAKIMETLRGEPLPASLEIENLTAAATPLPVAGNSRTPPNGEYLIPLTKTADGKFRIAGLPRSPGYDAREFDRPVIYPWNEAVKRQIPR